MNRRIATVVFLTMCSVFGRMTAQPQFQQSAAHLYDAGSGGHNISAAPVLVLTQNASALDAEEQKVTTFLSAEGFSYDVTDVSGLSTLNAADYSLIIFRTASTPASYNNGTVLTEIRDAVEVAGVTLMVELYGSYLAEYLGWGTVSSTGWGPVVAATCAFVAPITPHVIFDGIATWDPPIPPDKSDQIIWENPSINGGSGVHIVSIPNEVAIESWHVQMTPGWTGQPTNSTYCQSWGGCTNERSVHNAWNQTQNTKYVEKGNGKLFFCAPIGFGGAFSTDASVVIGKAGTALKRNTVQWLSGVLTPPDPPSNLTATAVSPTKVQLSWTDNSSSESRFVIEKKWNPTTWIRMDSVMANSTSHVIVNLQPDTEHSFRVHAANWKYESDPTNVASATTPIFPAPSDLSVDSLAVTSIVMHWRDNSTNEDRFVIEQSEDGIQWAEAATTGKDTTRKRVQGLVPERNYHFRVHAVEGAIQSGNSNVLTATTLTFQAPLNLQATGHSSEEIALQWQDQTDFEEGFMIEYREVNGGWLLADSVPANSSAHIVGALQPSTTYEFRVRAYTAQALSPYSNVAQATTLLFLQNPTNLAGVLMSETNVVLGWEDRSDGESGFEVEHQEDAGAWTLLHTAAANATTYDAQGLTPRTTNRFRVRAVGTNAASGYSNTVEIETRMAPAVPQNLLAAATDHKTVRITWQRGSENENGYEVERKDDGGSWALLTTAGPGDGDIRDENLPPATIYWYRVRAVNDLGASAWSNEDSAMTMNIPVPDPPFGLRAEATGPESINLLWAMPSPSTAEVFEIEMSMSSDPATFKRVPPDAAGNVRAHELHGLTPDTEYYFRIRAVNRSGPSSYSNTASARTSRADYPSTPRNFIATVRSESQIALAWQMPAPSNEDGFTLERSLTGDKGDFTELLPAPTQGARSYVDSGLTINTTYYYRLRAYNAKGSSPWTPVVSATTKTEIVTPALRAAMDAKQQVISQVQTLIPEGGTEMGTLRTLLGDYARGYDESAAEDLITEWNTTGASDPAQAAEAMERYVLLEEALRDSWGDDQAMPPVAGVLDLAKQCGRVPAIATKDLAALALAWKDERAFLSEDDPHVDAAMEDMILALSDNTRQLLTLMGADRGGELAQLTEDIIRDRGDVPDLAPGLMLSLLDYWPEHMLGRYYLPATQPLITTYADRTAQLDYDGEQSAAEGKRDVYLTALRTDIDALSTGFSEYYRIGTGLDRAYAIGQAPGAEAEIFLLRVKGLRPQLTDKMYEALAGAVIPTERFLYLTSQEAVKDLGSVPYALNAAGEKIFDPLLGGIVQRDDPLSVFAKTPAAANNPIIDADFAKLRDLRTKVEAADTDYIEDSFDALRISGKEMVAEVDRLLRPLLGVDRVRLYGDETLRGDYYYTLARMQLLKTRRTVLSVALADYMLTPTAQKQTELVAEIDSIIGPFGDTQDVQDVLTNLGTDVGSMKLLPALSLEDADIVRDEANGATRCRIRFEVKNVGGADAETPEAALSFLSSGVTAVGDPEYGFATLQPDAAVRDSLDVTINAGVTHVTISLTMESDGRVFIDRRTLPVPQSTTGVERPGPAPASCLLHQNYPNPFNPTTTISFTLPRPMTISLVVTDALGREVSRLADQADLHAGTHSVQFDAEDIPSGVYLYRLETEEVVLVKKMVVMR